MLDTTGLIKAAQWSGILALVIAVLAVLGFILKWGIRFRLVGVTGFMLVMTAGLFGLGLGIYSAPQVPGAAKYTTVYDAGATQVVIAVSPKISETELEATLRQAAINLFSYGRLGNGAEQMSIRARTILHAEPGLSQPLFLGEVKRSLAQREDDQMQITLYRENLAQLPKPVA